MKLQQPMNRSRRRFVSTGLVLAGASLAPWSVRASQPAQPFRLGALNSITGVGGPYGGAMLEAIRIAVDEVNAAGGAAGRQIQLYAEDDQTKPDAAVLAAKKLIEVNQVQAVVGIWPSSVGLAVMPITNNAGLIMMNTCGAPEMLTENRKGLAWMLQASNAVFGRAFAQVARERGFKRPAVMAFNNSTFVGLANYFKETWEKDGGKISSMVIYEPNQTTYRTELNRVLATQPDVIALGSYRPDATILLREWYQTGQDCKFIMPGWTANEALVKALGKEATEGIISISNVAASENAAYKSFSERFRAKFKQDPDIFAAQSYDMVIALALAIEAAGPAADTAAINGRIKAVTRHGGEKVSSFAQGRERLRAGKAVDYDGASSNLEFGEHGETVPDFGVSEIENGKLVLKETVPGTR
ncbi:ABC transporter substrate-binding protein [Bordetella hinzii]|nr:ABC transporter substrate-binding protein [Bordetella hinzii]AKQ54268.1 Leucine-, isoleucine-, valine-, threonine-, and alanine-binding protein precursor [Bordetella hinzii]AKQ58782.1 Leucine-, isoleucine-, valine-, threonine-, and alanine-binding protein precursor [Bordetella hinzii]KCB26137.1 receptor family ligand-binding protein [Bordetella hinzii OH87 BAL007II]KCB30839.1 receptor family ligand-binding protein [Bordetella hinzii L60]KCB41403.1 receptor family ligand-binding protein [Bor